MEAKKKITLIQNPEKFLFVRIFILMLIFHNSILISKNYNHIAMTVQYGIYGLFTIKKCPANPKYHLEIPLIRSNLMHKKH